MGSRRDFIKQGSLVGLAGAISPLETLASVREVSPRQKGKTKWLDGSRLVVWRFALIFGSSMQQNWSAVPVQLFHGFFLPGILLFLPYDKYSFDKKLENK